MDKNTNQVHTSTSQVQNKKLRKPSATDRALFQVLRTPIKPLFSERVGHKRKYPGAPEGSYLAAYLNELSARPSELKAFIDLLFTLIKTQRAMQTQRFETIVAIDAARAYARLKGKIDRQGAAHLTASGLVIPPESRDGKAALAALLLYGNSHLTRIRQCRHCNAWFYAHLDRQVFCSDSGKKCQWNHYHTPERRKKYRQRNLRYQREFRNRRFAKGKT
jgi:hypothetical protein